MRKYYIPIATLGLFVLEWLMLNQLMVLVDPKGHPRQSVWEHSGISYVLPVWFPNAWTVFILPIVLCAIPLINYFRFKRKKKKSPDENNPVSFLQTFIRIVKAEVGTLNGVVSVLFLVFNLAWTPDLLLEAIKGDSSWLYPLFTGMFLVVPFVWNQGKKNKPEKVKPEDRKFLITGLSYQMGKPEGNEKFFSKHHPGWCANWEPIRACLDYYPNLEKVLIIHSQETDEQANRTFISAIEKNFDNGEVKSLKALIEKSASRVLDVEEEIMPAQDKFNDFFPILKRNINAYLTKYNCKDEEVVFSINGGTAVLSAGLTFLSMPGRRGCVYSDQNWDKTPTERIQEFEVDIYSINELWNEIIEQSSGE